MVEKITESFANIDSFALPPLDTLQVWTETELEKLFERRVKSKIHKKIP